MGSNILSLISFVSGIEWHVSSDMLPDGRSGACVMIWGVWVYRYVHLHPFNKLLQMYKHFIGNNLRIDASECVRNLTRSEPWVHLYTYIIQQHVHSVKLEKVSLATYAFFGNIRLQTTYAFKVSVAIATSKCRLSRHFGQSFSYAL